MMYLDDTGCVMSGVSCGLRGWCAGTVTSAQRISLLRRSGETLLLRCSRL
jgi:hypothetical protein